MTTIRKSDAQLDAEASALPRNLEQAIQLHRALASAELFLPRLHQRDGEFGIGLPFSHPFERFLDGSFGPSFSWSAGLKAVRQDCRRTHSEHWSRPEWRGSLCATLVTLVCRPAYLYSFERACYELGVTPERTERTLLKAFRRIEQRLDEIQARETEVVKSSEGRHDWQAPAHVHRPLDGLHDAPPEQGGCIQCWRRRAAA